MLGTTWNAKVYAQCKNCTCVGCECKESQSLLKYFSCESNELISHVYCLPLTLSDAALWCEETKLCVNLYSQVLTITNQSVLIDN